MMLHATDVEKLLVEMFKEEILYELIKQANPMNTRLDSECRKIIEEVDPTFMRDHAHFFDNPFLDNQSADGILDWLYGYVLFASNKEEKRTRKIIATIEAHVI